MVVAGLGVSGRAAAEVLASRGARVVPVDDHADDVIGSAELLAGTVLDRADLVVASPGLRAAPPAPRRPPASTDVPVWSEVELAWHVRVDRAAGGGPAPWLAVTGTNGKTTTVGMLESILRAGGRERRGGRQRRHPRGARGDRPDARRPRRRAVELPAAPHVLDVRAGGRGAQRRTRPPRLARVARRLRGRQGPHLRARPGGVRVQPRRPAPPRTWSGRRTSSTAAWRSASRIGTPLVGQVGLVEDVLVDRGFARLRHTHAAELGTLDDLAQLAGPDGTVPPHVVANALAAAALALAHGVDAGGGPRRAARLRTGRAPPRSASPWSTASPTWTTPRRRTRTRPRRPSGRSPRAASCGSRAVWPRARSSTSSSRPARDRLRAVVLIGVDRAPLRDALARHAPEVPVVEVDAGETGPVMTRAVDEARRLAAEPRRRASAGHRPARARLRVDGPVHVVRRPGRGVRRRRACARWGRVTRQEGER